MFYLLHKTVSDKVKKVKSMFLLYILEGQNFSKTYIKYMFMRGIQAACVFLSSLKLYILKTLK